MKNTLKEIWKNRKQIFEGISNSIIRDQTVEHISALRMDICKNCSLYDSTGSGCMISGTQPCCDENKGGCGCSLKLKTKALSSDCPLGKWKALISEEEEDKLDNL